MTINWKKIILTALCVVIAVYLLLAMTVFNTVNANSKVCTMVKINIADGVVDGFLDADDIKGMLQQKGLYPKGKQMADVKVRRIEETLRKSPFVASAEVYKTDGGFVCIDITQRMPVVRVMADNGQDYYVDNNGGIMQNTRYVSDIMVATGHISRHYAQKVLTKVGNIIAADKFWQNQVVQLNVLHDGTIEMVPRVGDNIVYLGRPVSVQHKLDRLRKFYMYGLSRVGWNKYSYISLEFDNQIICRKRQHETAEPYVQQ